MNPAGVPGVNLTTLDWRVAEGGAASHAFASWLELIKRAVEGTLLLGPVP
jgi:hypothetical protein